MLELGDVRAAVAAPQDGAVTGLVLPVPPAAPVTRPRSGSSVRAVVAVCVGPADGVGADEPSEADADAEGDGEGDGLALGEAEADGEGDADTGGAEAVLGAAPAEDASPDDGSGTSARTSFAAAPSRDGVSYENSPPA